MTPIKKLKSRRGITLVEVLTVVALMAIMLGLAMPNLLAESQRIEMTALDGYARSVAVAAQSRLYGMKNAGTAADSEYATLNDNNASKETEITIGEEQKAVRYVCNFGDTKTGGNMLLSGAITDLELLEKGKIVVVYDPETADILYVFYSEREFDVAKLFPTVTESFLTDNRIGVYRGEGAPVPERKVRVPDFECTYVFEDEVYLELKMSENPSSKLANKHIGLEIYAEVPPIQGDGTYDEIGIYFEGFFASGEYTTMKAGTIVGQDGIYPLTFESIQANGGTLRFAIDSLVTNAAGYGAATKYLRRQTSPQYVSAAENLLYPRESLETWFDPAKNPYLTVWYRENEEKVPPYVHDLLFGGKPVTDYVGVAEAMKLRVVISILSDTTRAAKGTPGASLYEKDEEYTPFEVVSTGVSPYFHALSNETNKVTLSSVRDLKNLKYVFQTENPIDNAELSQDITGQQLYDKLMNVRYALFDKSQSDETVMRSWNIYANTDTMTFDTINQTKPFTISGKSSSGRFAISGVGFGGRANVMGGLFPYASDLTVEHLDIIDCWVQRNGFKNDFLKMDNETGTITGINATYQNAISGTLVGMAVNCTFNDVHVYIDKDKQLQVESDSNTLDGYHQHTNKKTTNDFGYLRTSGVVAGGLVGIAIGSNGITTYTHGSYSHKDSTSTTFLNCSASANVGAELYDQTSKCLYSGGLVGVTMGDVRIENSFAACQLGGYYAGGLVGGVAKPGDWAFDNVAQYGVPDTGGNKNYNENGTSKDGKLTIENSFASGIILRQVRVGGGLIADIGGTHPEVADCYSSVKWQILPPTAYGTFEGDNENYFIAQTYFAVPVTTNIEAHFTCTGDVFSLSRTNNGVACANETDLAAKLKGSGTAWSSAAATHYWQREVQDRYDQKGDEGHSYPFLMPTGNNVFSGSWIMDTIIDEGGKAVSFYDKNSQRVANNFESTFVGLFCAYYDASWSNLRQRNVDAGIIYAKKFSEANGGVFLNGQELTGKWWMKNSQFEIPYVGLTTDVSYENGVYQFTGYAYNDSLFDPVKQDEYKSKFTGDEFITHNDTTFNWDYFGFYFGDMAQDAKWGGMPDDTSYYIKFDKEVQQNIAVRDTGNNVCKINPEDFGSREKTFSLSSTSAQIKWSETDGVFYVNDGGAA